MIVIVMRHGEAEDYRSPDHTRTLTNNGKQQCEAVGQWLRQNLSTLTENTSKSVNEAHTALVSPFLRTQQTFRAVAKHFSIKQQITIDTITPNGNALECADLIHGYATDTQPPDCLMIVTHMPLVSLLSDKICAGFNAKFFKPADTLIIDYDIDRAMGEEVYFFQGV